MYNCKILADSISKQGRRLTTFEITYPYIIHAEIMTHRMFSRNTQSSRATPISKNIERVTQDPFIPLTFRKNVKGMADGEAMSDDQLLQAELAWSQAINDAVSSAETLARLDVHKALGNRVLSPYQWFTMILTATDFDNFFALRCHPEAQAEIRTIAEMMKEQYDQHTPRKITNGWHLPLIDWEEELLPSIPSWDDLPSWEGFDFGYWKKVSIGRCARVSYLTHDGRRDPEADIELYYRLLGNGHMSPFEHVARPFTETEWRFIDRAKDAMHNLIVLDPSRESGYIRGDNHPFVQLMDRQLTHAGNLDGWWSARMDVPHQANFALHQ